MGLREQAAQLKADMQAVVDRAKAESRDLTVDEANEIEAKASEYESIKERLDQAEKAQRMVADLASAPAEAPEPEMEVDVELRCADIQSLTLENASMAVLNFTLQFVPLSQRLSVLEQIYKGLNPGGVLILSEKVVFDDEPHNELMIELHHNFKRANGYSDLEIAQKRSALEQVLLPESLATHRSRLRHAGFSSVDVWFQCFNFASLIAIK